MGDFITYELTTRVCVCGPTTIAVPTAAGDRGCWQRSPVQTTLLRQRPMIPRPRTLRLSQYAMIYTACWLLLVFSVTSFLDRGFTLAVAGASANRQLSSGPLARLATKASSESIFSPKKPPVPKFVHFIYGLDSDSVPEFGFLQWLSIVSSYASIRPSRIFFWHRAEPKGEWWERARPFVTDLREARDVVEVFGNPVTNYAHKADILRLEILIEHGGIYLDSDFVVWKSFDHLLESDCVLAHEGERGWVGLGNSAIIARPASKFLLRWLDAYKDFDGREWNRHSIVMPKLLAFKYPREVRVLGYDPFFWPLWNEDGLQRMYTEKVHDFENAGLANHLWESKAFKFVLADAINEETISQVDFPLFCGMRMFLAVKAPSDDAKTGSGGFVWESKKKITSRSMPAGCQIFDQPMQESPLGEIQQISPRFHFASFSNSNSSTVAFYDFDNDKRHPLKLLDASANNLNGWFINPSARANRHPSQFIHFSTFPPPLNISRRFDRDQGTFAILPTLRRHGQSFHSFTFSLWFSFDPVDSEHRSHITLLEAVGDCHSYGTGEKCPVFSIRLQRREQATRLKLGPQIPLERPKGWALEAGMFERGSRDSGMITKLAAISTLKGGQELNPSTWYRVQVSASRSTQLLKLKLWNLDNEEMKLVTDLQVDHYSSFAILPLRIRSIWLGAPWHLDGNQLDSQDYLSGFIDRFVLASQPVEDAEDLVKGRSSGEVKPSFAVSAADTFSNENQGQSSQIAPNQAKEVKLPRLLPRSHPSKSLPDVPLATSMNLWVDTLIVEVALDPTFFLVCLCSPLACFLLQRSRRARKWALLVVVVVVVGYTTGEITGQVGSMGKLANHSRSPMLTGGQLIARSQIAKKHTVEISAKRPTRNNTALLSTLAELPRSGPKALATAKIAQPIFQPKEANQFTIIMPCYNQAHYVSEALDSVFVQTSSNWDLILVDDHSPDRCYAKALAFARKRFPSYKKSNVTLDTSVFPSQLLIRELKLSITTLKQANGTRSLSFVSNSANCGLSCSRNIAIFLAKTPWILPLDADDKIHRSYLAALSRTIQVDPALGLVTGASQRFFGESDWTWWLPGWSPRKVLESGPFPVSTAFRKEDWYRVAGYNPLLPWGNEDWSFWISLSWLPGMSVKLIGIDEYPEFATNRWDSFTYYRFKSASMARSKDEHAAECEAALVTLHSAVFGPARTLNAHDMLLAGATAKLRELVEDASKKAGKGDELGQGSEVALWLGLWWESQVDDKGSERDMKIETARAALDWYIKGFAKFGEISEVGELEDGTPRWMPNMRRQLPPDWQLWWRAGVALRKLARLSNDPVLEVVEVPGFGTFTSPELCERAAELGGPALRLKIGGCLSGDK